MSLRPLALLAVLLLAAAMPAAAQQAPANPDPLRLLGEDLKIATNLVYNQCRAAVGDTPVTKKLGALANQAREFYLGFPRLLDQPGPLVAAYTELAERYQAARPVVAADAPAPVALTFQWVEMLMVKIGMYFGQSLSQSDFPPGASLPQGELVYSVEGLAGLAQQAWVLANQVYVIASAGGPLGPQREQASDQWLAVATAAQALRDGVDANLSQEQLLQRFQNLSIAWQKAVPLFGNLEPTFTQKQDFAMLLSDYVRLRAAYGQLYSGILWGRQDPGSVD